MPSFYSHSPPTSLLLLTLRASLSARSNFNLQAPLDGRIPYCIVARTDVPEADRDFFANPGAYTRRLFAATIVRWPQASRFPHAQLKSSLGEAGEIGPETAAILYQCGVRDAPFDEAAMACLARFEAQTYTVEEDAPPAGAAPAPALASAAATGAAASAGAGGAGGAASEAVVPPPLAKPRSTRIWRVPPAEMARRVDFRHLRIFTCDPTTAKDLDDALHVTVRQCLLVPFLVTTTAAADRLQGYHDLYCSAPLLLLML